MPKVVPRHLQKHKAAVPLLAWMYVMHAPGNMLWIMAGAPLHLDNTCTKRSAGDCFLASQSWVMWGKLA
jgi:hypothetical protein